MGVEAVSALTVLCTEDEILQTGKTGVALVGKERLSAVILQCKLGAVEAAETVVAEEESSAFMVSGSTMKG